VKHIKENPNQVSLITLGPLSNLATAILQYPELPQYVNRIGIMGGSFFTYGNISPLAEANIFNDPDAAKIVFNSQWKNSIIAPLNVTHKVNMDEEFLGEIKNIGEIGKTIYYSHQHYINYHNVHFKVTDIPCHDPTPIVYFLYPDIFESMSGYVDVETSGTLTSGVTLMDVRGFREKKIFSKHIQRTQHRPHQHKRTAIQKIYHSSPQRTTQNPTRRIKITVTFIKFIENCTIITVYFYH